jgi:hypothetical protein
MKQKSFCVQDVEVEGLRVFDVKNAYLEVDPMEAAEVMEEIYGFM